MVDEIALRAKIVEEAKTWLGTPYVSNGMVKGKRGGTDCAMILIGVYGAVGLIPKDFDPRPYPAQWHVHRNEEKYLHFVLTFADEVKPPSERKPLPADLVLFKIGKLFAHGAIIVDWPIVIHTIGNDKVRLDNISMSTTGKRALARVEQRFFCLKDFNHG